MALYKPTNWRVSVDSKEAAKAAQQAAATFEDRLRGGASNTSNRLFIRHLRRGAGAERASKSAGPPVRPTRELRVRSSYGYDITINLMYHDTMQDGVITVWYNVV